MILLGGAFNVSPLISYHLAFPALESEGQTAPPPIFDMNFLFFLLDTIPRKNFFFDPLKKILGDQIFCQERSKEKKFFRAIKTEEKIF